VNAILARSLAIAGCAFALLLPSLANATTFSVDPTRLIFTTATSGDVVVTNTGDSELRMTIHAYTWTQDGRAREHLVETDHVVYYPEIFTLAPGASQRIRVGVTDNPTSIERAYRLILAEIPSHQHIGAPVGVTFFTRVDMPIFIAPTSAQNVEPQLALSQDRSSLDALISNAGTMHLAQSSLSFSVRDAAGHTIWSDSQDAFYVLPHQAQLVEEHLARAICQSGRTLHVDWRVNGATISRSLALHREQCH
jgi:P pilus assembly chaperone PapD